MRWKRERRRMPRGAHLVDGSKVGCPIQGADVSVSQCLACGAFKRMGEIPEEGLAYIVCSPPIERTPAYEQLGHV